MSFDSTDGSDGVGRRSVLQGLGATGLASVGAPSTGASLFDPRAWRPAADEVPEPPVVRGSTEQVLVIGVAVDATVELHDSEGTLVDSATITPLVDDYDLGSHAFREVTPGTGYEVVVDTDGGTETLAEDVEVFPEDYVPDQALYEDQTLSEDTPDGEIEYMEMRDGTQLACRVSTPFGDPPHPTLIMYDGYAPSVDMGEFASIANFYGYAIVGVNKRGTQCSGGKFDLWETVQSLDGYDIVETVAAQDWSENIGLVGASYPGFSQFYMAVPHPPSLDAITPGVPVGDFYRDVGWPGGMLNSHFAANWARDRDVQAEPFTDDGGMGDVDERVHEDDLCYFNHYLRDQNEPTEARLTETAYYEGPLIERNPRRFVDQIEVPTLLMSAWQDEQVGSRATRLLEQFTDDHPVHFVGINGDHLSMLAFYEEIIDFLDFYVRGIAGTRTRDLAENYEEALAEYQAHPYRIYWEQDHNRSTRAVTDYAEWPPAQTWELYLQPDGSLGPEPPTTATASSTYEFVSPPSEEQRMDRDEDNTLIWEQEVDDEHLSFVSEPLTSDHVLIGSGFAELWLDSTADNTDIQVDLIEVRPDGMEMYVQSGWLRASKRAEDEERSLPRRPWHTFQEADEQPLSEEFDRLRVEFHPFGHPLRAGSRLKLAITNPGNTRDRWAFDLVDETATNEIAHSETHPSRLVLPLVPDEGAPISEYPDCGEVLHQPCRESDVEPLEDVLELPEFVDGVQPTDHDGDGLFEDLDGSGGVGVTDVQLLFDALDREDVQDHAWAFNFSRMNQERVTVFDVQALFNMIE